MKSFEIKNFKYPDSRFRGLPLWAWNTDVTADKVIHQVETFREMGFGGFIIHARKGLRTEYMGEHFMDMVRLAIKKAKELDLRVWLYDEDGWPSGYAGGAVTTEKKYRQKTLLFTKEKLGVSNKEQAIEKGEPYLLAAFDVTLENGFLKSYRQTENGPIFAYVCTAEDNPRFNWQAYIDTMNPEAVRRFTELTHEKYYSLFGDDFGGTVEAVFTDEPQIAREETIAFSDIGDVFSASIPWSDDFPITYMNEYGEDIIKKLPEIIFELEGAPNTVRYRFNAHIADRFRLAFSKQIEKWCREHNIKFTGHYLYEQSLEVQNLSLRDVMRNYEDQDIPGIDILLGDYEFTTAMQCSSVAHQSGKAQMMSELYGVTNYTSDFRDYIHWGNWQAALGVTERIPHLTWMSMLGEGKRDYPANFGYQAPWYRQFSKVEDHFARINAAFEGGTPTVKVGMIHPIESHWMIYGPKDKTMAERQKRDNEFHGICEALLFDCIDFDYINEALLPSQYDGKRNIGRMQYDAIVVPDCLTLRKSTVDILGSLRKNGTRIIFAGDVPHFVDGQKNSAAEELAKSCENIGLCRKELAEALSPLRSFELLKKGGQRTREYIYRESAFQNDRVIFICPAKAIEDKENSDVTELIFSTEGYYTPTLLDTYSGEVFIPEYEYKNKKTLVYLSLCAYDSVLLYLKKEKSEPKKKEEQKETKTQIKPALLSVCRSEDNVLLLDMAEYSFDGEKYFGEEEILRIDGAARKEFGLPSISGKVSPQPWSVCDDVKKKLFLRFSFDSKIETKAALAFEGAVSVSLNGEKADLSPIGYYVDKDIKRIALPTVKKGRNILEAQVTLTKTVGAEPMYLLGDFGVVLDGIKKTVTAPENMGFENIAAADMPFYGGNLAYELAFTCDGGDVLINVAKYRGTLLCVAIDGEDRGDIILPPYTLCIKNVKAGEHKLVITCFGNRHNTFGSLHFAEYDPYCGPMHWHKIGDAFSYDYRLCEVGITEKPRIYIVQ